MINTVAELRTALAGLDDETPVRIQVRDDVGGQHRYVGIEAAQTVEIITDGPRTWLQHTNPPQWDLRCAIADYAAEHKRLTRPGITGANGTPGTDHTLYRTANVLAICSSENVYN